MDNLFITIAVVVMYAFMLLASNRSPTSDAPTPEPDATIIIQTSDTLDTPLFMLPDSGETSDSL